MTTVILVLVVRFSAAQVAAVKEQKAIVEERLQNKQEDLERTEKWSERRIEALEAQLTSVLDEGGITQNSLFDGIRDIGGEVRHALEPIVEELQSLLITVPTSASDADPIKLATHLDLGKALSVSHEWLGAAKHYEVYVRQQPEDWQVHFLHGAALANSRMSDETNLDALRAYSEAITFVPSDIDLDTLARLHTYRGAMLRRLRRFAEAESEFVLSLSLSSQEYELSDAHYNLASLYALQGEREPMLRHLRSLTEGHRADLRSHPHFSAFAGDHEFIQLTSRGPI
ncbi:MAG: hypothetical protein ACC652_10015 [Acidimicrobiales bacterium]